MVSTKQPPSSNALPYRPPSRSAIGIAAAAASSSAPACLYVALSRLCMPSQNGGVRVCLQPHRTTSPVTFAVKCNGRNDELACEPSQNGCFALSPQVHHK